MSKPTVIHIVNDKGRLCGTEFDSGWAARYCNDAFARTLPQCPDCLAAMEVERLELSEPIESVVLYQNNLEKR